MSRINKMKVKGQTYDIQDKDLGNLEELSTEDKSSGVAAINEINTNKQDKLIPDESIIITEDGGIGVNDNREGFYTLVEELGTSYNYSDRLNLPQALRDKLVEVYNDAKEKEYDIIHIKILDKPTGTYKYSTLPYIELVGKIRVSNNCWDSLVTTTPFIFYSGYGGSQANRLFNGKLYYYGKEVDGKFVPSDTTWCYIQCTDVSDLKNYLSKNNGNAYTPTGKYHPATKDYVDNITGTLANLNTETKNNLVNAINEINNNVIIVPIVNVYGDNSEKNSSINIERMQAVLPFIGKKDIILRSIEPDDASYNTIKHRLFFLSPYEYNDIEDITTYSGDLSWESENDRYVDFFNDKLYLCDGKKNIRVTIENGQVTKLYGTSGGSGSYTATKDLQVLHKTNTKEYTPTDDYHPATKIYVDNAVAAGGGSNSDESDLGIYTWEEAPFSTSRNYNLKTNYSEFLSGIINDAYKKGKTGILIHGQIKPSTPDGGGYNTEVSEYLLVSRYNIQNKPTMVTLSSYGVAAGDDATILKIRVRINGTWNENDEYVISSAYMDGMRLNLNNYLAKDNTTSYTPTKDYHPATKQYVDNFGKEVIEFIDSQPTTQELVDDGFQYLARNEIVPINYTIEDVSETYKFTLNDNGYYESGNKAVNNSWSLCRVTFNNEIDVDLTIDYISSGESNFDYGIFGKLDTNLDNSYNEDTSDKVEKSCKGEPSTEVKQLTYHIPAGEHFIEIKYRKDQSSNTGNDSLQFKIQEEQIIPVYENRKLATNDYVDEKIGDIETILATLVTVEEEVTE